MKPELSQAQFIAFFKEHARTGYAHLKGSQEKGSNFDPYRNTGYTVTKKNPKPFKLLYRPLSASSLAQKELGVIESGAIEILIRNNDIGLIKLSDQLTIKNKKYVAWNNKVGNRLQLFESQFSGFSKIIVFLRVN